MTDLAINSNLFECSKVSVFKIPPGNISLSQWSIYESNVVWKGGLRLIEQHQETQSEVLPPRDVMRLKLELFNTSRAQGDSVWGIVYYNPQEDATKQETIQRSESYKFFKIIIQIPDSLYYNNPGDSVTQVGLGLTFHDKIDAYTFIEQLIAYQKLYQGYVQQYNHDININQLILQQESLSLDSDDEFGDFVGD